MKPKSKSRLLSIAIVIVGEAKKPALTVETGLGSSAPKSVRRRGSFVDAVAGVGGMQSIDG